MSVPSTLAWPSRLTSEIETEPFGKIRRVNVEIPRRSLFLFFVVLFVSLLSAHISALSVSDFRRLKDMNHVGTYTVFQETYDPELYSKVWKQLLRKTCHLEPCLPLQYHPSGPKADYGWRLQVHDRAMTAGIDDVGIGALFGLGDYRNEVMALLMHANHLQVRWEGGGE